MTATFALASCQYPPGLLDREVAEASYRRLLSWLDGTRGPKPSTLVLVGDQVYVDATAGLFDPTAQYDRYVRPYERLLRMEPLQQALGSVRVKMMLDDHEIVDNWEPVAGDRSTMEEMRAGRSSYLAYQRIAGPPPKAPCRDSKMPLWHDFDVGGYPFFMADTRTERTQRKAETIESARIMSECQFEALLTWLSEKQKSRGDLPKFVACPSTVLPRRLRATQDNHPANALRSDAWDGYPYSLHRLLSHIAEHPIRNVVFLSGDEHLSFVARARITGAKNTAIVHQVHSSPLYGPFPFANSIEADLAGREAFCFTGPARRHMCTVATKFPEAGDGFAVLSLTEETRGWRLSCTFDRHREPGSKIPLQSIGVLLRR